MSPNQVWAWTKVKLLREEEEKKVKDRSLPRIKESQERARLCQSLNKWDCQPRRSLSLPTRRKRYKLQKNNHRLARELTSEILKKDSMTFRLIKQLNLLSSSWTSCLQWLRRAKVVHLLPRLKLRDMHLTPGMKEHNLSLSQFYQSPRNQREVLSREILRKGSIRNQRCPILVKALRA